MDELNQANYSLSASRPDDQSGEETVNPLPRAVLRLNSHLLLDGTWHFAHDAQDQGLREIRFVGAPDQRDLAIQRVVQRSGLRGPKVN